MYVPVTMAIYYAGQRFSFRAFNRHVMTTLENISPTVFNLPKTHPNNNTQSRNKKTQKKKLMKKHYSLTNE